MSPRTSQPNNDNSTIHTTTLKKCQAGPLLPAASSQLTLLTDRALSFKVGAVDNLPPTSIGAVQCNNDLIARLQLMFGGVCQNFADGVAGGVAVPFLCGDGKDTPTIILM